MKKLPLLFIFLYTLSYTLITDASLINLESTQTFNPSKGIVESRDIYVTISDFNSGSTNKNFSITLPEDSNIRFSSDFSGISFSGNATGKVGTGITIMPSLREVKFNLLDSFKNGDSIKLSGLKLIIYSKPQGDKYLGLDLNGDGITDSVSTNGYRVDSTYAYSDTLPPSEVFNLTGSIVDNKFTISADMPGDVDFQAVILENLDAFGNILLSFFRYDLNNFTYDLQTNYDSIRLKTVDIRANNSKGLVYKLDYFRKIQSESNSTGTVIETSSGITVVNTSTGTTIHTDIIVNNIIPLFVNQVSLLKKVVAFVDSFIIENLPSDLDIEDYNSAIIIRNSLVNELLKLDVASVDKKIVIVDNIRKFFKELVNKLKSMK